MLQFATVSHSKNAAAIIQWIKVLQY